MFWGNYGKDVEELLRESPKKFLQGFMIHSLENFLNILWQFQKKLKVECLKETMEKKESLADFFVESLEEYQKEFVKSFQKESLDWFFCHGGITAFMEGFGNFSGRISKNNSKGISEESLERISYTILGRFSKRIPRGPICKRIIEKI